MYITTVRVRTRSAKTIISRTVDLTITEFVAVIPSPVIAVHWTGVNVIDSSHDLSYGEPFLILKCTIFAQTYRGVVSLSTPYSYKKPLRFRNVIFSLLLLFHYC